MSDLLKEELDRVLHTDPISEAEKVTGKSYKEDRATETLGVMMHLERVKDKEALLELSGDTCFSNTLGRYIEIINSVGFVESYREPFFSESSKREEYLFIFWEPRRGILLEFDTFCGNVNGGDFYYNWIPKDQSKPWSRCLSSGGFQGEPGNYVFAGHHDCREALKYHIQCLEEEGSFVCPWQYAPCSLFVMSHMDWKVKDCDFKKLTAERLSKLPQEVRDSIKVKL